jgi:hypothetical protein
MVGVEADRVPIVALQSEHEVEDPRDPLRTSFSTSGTMRHVEVVARQGDGGGLTVAVVLR